MYQVEYLESVITNNPSHCCKILVKQMPPFRGGK